MSDLLFHLAQRATSPQTVVMPRVPSLFEKPRSSSLSPVGEDTPFLEQFVEMDMDERRMMPVSPPVPPIGDTHPTPPIESPAVRSAAGQSRSVEKSTEPESEQIGGPAPPSQTNLFPSDSPILSKLQSKPVTRHPERQAVESGPKKVAPVIPLPHGPAHLLLPPVDDRSSDRMWSPIERPARSSPRGQTIEPRFEAREHGSRPRDDSSETNEREAGTAEAASALKPPAVVPGASQESLDDVVRKLGAGVLAPPRSSDQSVSTRQVPERPGRPPRLSDRAPRGSLPEPTIEISIGRIEVRAPAAPTARQALPARPAGATPSLSQYLRLRNGGRR